MSRKTFSKQHTSTYDPYNKTYADTTITVRPWPKQQPITCHLCHFSQAIETGRHHFEDVLRLLTAPESNRIRGRIGSAINSALTHWAESIWYVATQTMPNPETKAKFKPIQTESGMTPCPKMNADLWSFLQVKEKKRRHKRGKKKPRTLISYPTTHDLARYVRTLTDECLTSGRDCNGITQLNRRGTESMAEWDERRAGYYDSVTDALTERLTRAYTETSEACNQAFAKLALEEQACIELSRNAEPRSAKIQRLMGLVRTYEAPQPLLVHGDLLAFPLMEEASFTGEDDLWGWGCEYTKEAGPSLQS